MATTEPDDKVRPPSGPVVAFSERSGELPLEPPSDAGRHLPTPKGGRPDDRLRPPPPSPWGRFSRIQLPKSPKMNNTSSSGSLPFPMPGRTTVTSIHRPKEARISDSSKNSDRSGNSNRGGSKQTTGSYPGAPEEEEPLPPSWLRYVYYAAYTLVESKIFTFITTILTVYALLGDDIRLLVTNSPADTGFNVLTIICIIVFTLEIFVFILGKADYFLSFFFVLDVVATVTFIFDLTWVGEGLRGDEEELENIRGSRMAKIGAKAGRIVRVLRLVRILKLYKAYYEARRHARGKPKAKVVRSNSMPVQRRGSNSSLLEAGMAADLDDIDTMPQSIDEMDTESKVGKKLSELTTRRVIIIVLVMMLTLPFLQTDTSQQFPTSANYGADIMHEAYMRMEANPGDASMRLAYEKALLHVIYFHNWYNWERDECPHDRMCSKDYYSNLFWVGFVSGSRSSSFLEAKAEDAQIRSSTVTAWEDTSANADHLYTFGAMPQPVQETLGRSWDEMCISNSGKYKRVGFSLLKTELEDWGVHYAVPCPDDLRSIERRKFAPALNVRREAFEEWHFAFYFDLRPFVRSEALYSIAITAFVCLALLATSYIFSKDADSLVLHPVEKMVRKVDTIRTNPLAAIKVWDEQLQDTPPPSRPKWFLNCSQEEEEPMETAILDMTILKLGSLLALGFGEAGVHVIEHNMYGVDSACVNVMVEGTSVECIIGATRISNFGIATQVLQGKVMTFVNQVAEIVHGVANEFHGAPNKNNGDMFLIIWRTTRPAPASRDDLQVELSRLADMSVLAFTKILGAVSRSPVLAEYRQHPGLQQRLGKHCWVTLSCGLHHGWAIEGAVGSEYKIDASYLSPNVSIAESIERATQIYGVSCLVAESVVSLCTPAMAANCRRIDRVIITGSVKPMDLYTVDLDYKCLLKETLQDLDHAWSARQRVKVRKWLEREKTRKLSPKTDIPDLFARNQDIIAMRRGFSREFFGVFNMGYQNYSQGEWEVAQRLLQRTLWMLKDEDGPSAALLRFMEDPYKFEAPKNWQGVHTLDLAVPRQTPPPVAEQKLEIL